MIGCVIILILGPLSVVIMVNDFLRYHLQCNTFNRTRAEQEISSGIGCVIIPNEAVLGVERHHLNITLSANI